jgi:type I restriction enzyme S subunit
MSEPVRQSEVRGEQQTAQIGPREVAIPADWDVVPFKEAVELNPKYEKPDNGPFDFLPMDAVDEEKQTVEYWNKREKDDCTTTWFKNGDTVYPKITPCTENGKIAFITDVETEVGSGSTEFLVFHPRDGVTDERFVYYLSNLPEFRAVTISLMEGSTGRQRVPSDVFESSIQIPLPSLSEQRRIADILSTIDEQIQQTDEIIEKGRELRHGLLQELFHRGTNKHARILDPDELADKAGGVNTGMDQTTVGQIPEEWETERLGEVTENSAYGVNASAEEFDPRKPRYVRITDIDEDGHLKHDDPKSISRDVSEGCELEPGDLVFARTGATVGKTLLYQEDHPEAAYAGYLIRFQLDRSRILPKFAFYFTQTDNYNRWVSRITRQGAQENINTGEYCSILLPLPSIAEQQKIVSILETVDQEIEQERQTKQVYKDLKRGLMQDLLTGTVRTPPTLGDGDATSDT